MDSEPKLSKNEQKRLDKQAKVAAEKKKKEEEKAKKAAEQPAQEEKAPKKKLNVATEDEVIEPSQYFEGRCKVITKQKEVEKDTDYFPYPHKWNITHTVPELLAAYDSQCTEKGKFLEDISVSTAGRVVSIRTMGGSLVFYDIQGEGVKFQIMGNMKLYGNEDDFMKLCETIKRGDIIGVTGNPGRTKAGEFSICPKKLKLLSPCLHILPTTKYGLKDMETRYRQRYLDLMINDNVRKTFETRSKILRFIRNYLDDLGFLEVETPVLNMIAGGATAKPFITKYNALNMDVFMRIAPELYLKMLIVGGLDKVYEMGKLFRNEGMDQTHNPEFTSVEFYWAYKDYNDLMDFTEVMLNELVKKVCGSEVISITMEDGSKKEISFKRPFKRIPIITGLEDVLGVTFPTDLTTEEARAFLDALAKKHDVDCPAPRSTTRLIDKLAGEKLEPLCVHPTFLIDHPQIMCPLAKYHRSKPGLAERFELFINECELINAYTELNDPFVQRELFEGQGKAKAGGDDEACDIDYGFITAMEHALPPTAGWGMGVDRLCMLLTDNANCIQEVILFPAMKPKINDGGSGNSVNFSSNDINGVEEFLGKNQWLSGKDLPGDQDYNLLKEYNDKNFVPCSDKFPNAFGWFWNVNSCSAPSRELWKSHQAPAQGQKSAKVSAKNTPKKE